MEATRSEYIKMFFLLSATPALCQVTTGIHSKFATVTDVWRADRFLSAVRERNSNLT